MATTPTVEAPSRQHSDLYDRLRSYFWCDPLIWAWTAIMGAISLFSSLFDRGGRFQHRCAHLWSRGILAIVGAPVTVSGAERVDMAKPHLYAFNHLSAMDVPTIYVHLAVQFRIIAKKELFRYPFMGWHLSRSGQIAIDRDNARASMRSLNRAVESLRGGMPLVVFPEGGRSADGTTQPFLPGAFYVAIKAGVEVVPVALVGSYDVLPMNTYTLHPRPIEVVFGDPIPTTGLTLRDMDSLAQRAQAAVEDMYYARARIPRPARTDAPAHL